MPDTHAAVEAAPESTDGTAVFEHSRRAYLLLSAAARLEEDLLAELARIGASTNLSEHFMLTRLLAGKSPSITELARASLLQQPTATKLLDTLEREGLIVRTSDPKDRRVKRIVLTAEGEDVARLHFAAERRAEVETCERVEPLRRQELLDALRDAVDSKR